MFLRAFVITSSLILSAPFAHAADDLICTLSTYGAKASVSLPLFDLNAMFTGASTEAVAGASLKIQGDCLNHDCNVSLELTDLATLKNYPLTDIGFNVDAKGIVLQKKWLLSADRPYVITCKND